jgi:hypothetical protein
MGDLKKPCRNLVLVLQGASGRLRICMLQQRKQITKRRTNKRATSIRDKQLHQCGVHKPFEVASSSERGSEGLAKQLALPELVFNRDGG